MSGAAIAMALTAQAWGAGFEVKERSATAQGSANAGASSGADDISYMYFNPASIAFHSGFNAAAGASYIIPSAEVSNASGFALGVAPISGSGDNSDAAALVPSTYLSAQLSDTVYLGLGITSPFGLVTDYDDDWIGRYHATRSELLTINISPTIAYRPIPEIAIAGGPVIEYADASLANALDFGAIGAGLGVPGAAALAGGGADGSGKVEGDDFAFGYALGIIIEPRAGTRIGAGFRSEIEHNVDLTASFVNDGSGIAATAQGLGAFTDGGAARTTVSAPAQLNLGVTQELSDNWAVMFDAQWTQWSSFEELRIVFDDATPDSVTTENWDDTWFLSLGARYRANDDLTLRFGAAYDTGATPDEHRTPRIPDADRIWGSFGATYALTDMFAVSGAYTYVHVQDSSIALSGTAENAARGSLNADVESDVHIITLGGSVKF